MTPAQIANRDAWQRWRLDPIRVGTTVAVTRDDGRVEWRVVQAVPWCLAGIWFVRLEGLGLYALERVQRGTR